MPGSQRGRQTNGCRQLVIIGSIQWIGHRTRNSNERFANQSFHECRNYRGDRRVCAHRVVGKINLIGFEVDLAKKIAKDMGVRPEFKVYDWEEIIPALQQGDIDIIAGGMAITPARALKVEFSRPTAESGVGLATNTAMTQNIKTFAELNDSQIVIATVANTHAVSVAEVLFDRANVKTYPTVEIAEREVLEGRAHAYLAGLPHAKFLALKHSDKIDVPVTEPLLAQSEAIAVRKGEQSLLNFLNAWVTARQTDKWLPTTRDYWFDTMDWASDPK